jgi:DNA-binding transcriptional LysR family regulator
LTILGSTIALGYTLSQWVGSTRWSFDTDGTVTVPVGGILRTNNGEALVAAAVAGQGIVYAPTFLVAAEFRAGRLIEIALDHPTIELPVAALYPSDRRPPAKLRAFLDFLEERIKPTPRWDRSITEFNELAIFV